LGDITDRAKSALRDMDFVACEDTRVSAKLLSLVGAKAAVFSLHDFNEEKAAAKIAALIRAGRRVALISDAGTPLISDPGFKAVRALRKAGHYITACPGACAAIDALVLSGLPSGRFMFAGFAPRSASARREFFADLCARKCTCIFHEAANRLLDSLRLLDEIAPGREIVVARELTKMHEEVCRGTAAELVRRLPNPRGEVVGLVAPAPDARPAVDARALLEKLLPHMPLKPASAFIAETFGLAKSSVYALGLSLKK
jgi:16S rRNA (cytidine1402-2'-O)-methyltransferase